MLQTKYSDDTYIFNKQNTFHTTTKFKNTPFLSSRDKSFFFFPAFKLHLTDTLPTWSRRYRH